MLKTILILFVIILFLVLSLPVLLVCKLLYPHYPAQVDRFSLALIRIVMKVIFFLTGSKLTVLGEENVPKDQAVMYAGNHRSWFDVVITYSRVPALTGFISKKSIEKVPVINWWMNRLHCLFLDRDNIKEGLKTILAAIDTVKNGISIFIFPEGTRNKTSDAVLEFKAGSFKIAEKSGCLIVPVTLTNTEEILENHFPRIKKARIVLEYGKPIDLNTLDKEERKHINTYVQNIIAQTYIKNKQL